MEIIFRCKRAGHPYGNDPPLLFKVDQKINQPPIVKVYEHKRRRDEESSHIEMNHFKDIKEIDIGRTRWGYLIPMDVLSYPIAEKAFEHRSKSDSLYWVNDHCYNSNELRFWIGSAQIECAYGHTWSLNIDQVLNAAHDAFMAGDEVVLLGQPFNPAKSVVHAWDAESHFWMSALRDWAAIEADRWRLSKVKSSRDFVAKNFIEYLSNVVLP